MNPTINGTKIQIYRIAEDVEKHSFRNRPNDKENSYTLVKEMKIQAVWYSHEELRQLSLVDRIQSSGYFIFKNSAIRKLDIDPNPDGGNWNRYRFKFNINGTYSNRYLEIVEMRPESPYRGRFRLWYAYFTEARVEPKMPSLEQTLEHSEEKFRGLSDMTDVIVRYE